MVRWESYGVTNVGKVRRNNEDSYATVTLNMNYHGEKDPLKMLIVADGMGGHNAGEVASEMAVRMFIGMMTNTSFPSDFEGIKKIVEDVLNKINTEIYSSGLKNEEYRDMGTTFVAFISIRGIEFVVNLGDSRGYVFRNGKLKRVTKDHTYVQKLVESGIIDEDEAKEHPQRHVLLQALGVRDKIEPEFHEIRLDYGDLILLCSDGLTDMVEDEEIEKIIKNNLSGSLRKIGDSLVQRALDNGGKDNVTVVLGRRVK